MGLAEHVIAAPGGMDQPSEPGRAAAAFTVGVLVLAVLAAGLILRRRWYRLSPVLGRPEVLSPPIGLALVLVMLIIAPIGAQIAARLSGIEMEPDVVPTVGQQARLAAGAYAAQMLVAFVYLRRLRKVRILTRERRHPRERAVFVGVAALLLAWPLVSVAGWAAGVLLTVLGAPPPDMISHETLELLLDGPRDSSFGMLVVLVTVVAPVLEELLYRGLLQDAMRRIGVSPWLAISVTSFFFALMHWGSAPLHALVGLFVLSLAFGWSFERTGRLLAPIVMHVLFNLGNLVVALLIA
jgi:membrane protease YdiL (CAAX protease family)